MDKCHYCGSYTTNNKENYYEHTMYGVVKSHLITGMGFSYLEKKVLIPRCVPCKKIHVKYNYLLIVFVLIPLFVLAMLGSYLFFTNFIEWSNMLLIPSLLISYLVSVGGYMLGKEIIGEYYSKIPMEDNIANHVEVINLIKKGWKLEKPARNKDITNKDLIDESPYKK